MKTLDDLEALHAKATVGPWRHGAVEKYHVFTWLPEGHERVLCRMNEHFPHEDDARAIAAAHNALPALLKVARASIALRESGMQFDDAHSKAEADWMAALDELAEVKP